MNPTTDDSPSARLTALGPRALSTTELLALLFTDYAAATELMTSVQSSLRVLASRPASAVQQVKGIGQSKSHQLIAALELGRRVASEPRGDVHTISTPQDVVSMFAPHLEALDVEEFHIVVLDAQHHLVRDILVTRGILDSSMVHPREVFRQAIAERAASIILVHNHPSGDPTPSAEDYMVTSQLVAGGTLLGVPVRDHVIIGHGCYVSFAESGRLSTVR